MRHAPISQSSSVSHSTRAFHVEQRAVNREPLGRQSTTTTGLWNLGGTRLGPQLNSQDHCLVLRCPVGNPDWRPFQLISEMSESASIVDVERVVFPTALRKIQVQRHVGCSSQSWHVLIPLIRVQQVVSVKLELDHDRRQRVDARSAGTLHIPILQVATDLWVGDSGLAMNLTWLQEALGCEDFSEPIDSESHTSWMRV